jgi:proline racemase
MFGCVLAPPTREDVDFGIIWIDNRGYLNMCGHGTIGIGVTAVECGLVPVTEPTTTIRMDTPAGVVEIRVSVEQGRARRAAFTNVPAFAFVQGHEIDVPDYGRVPVDVAFGGSFFGAVRAADLGIEVRPERVDELVRAGLALREAINQQIPVRHPTLDHIRSVDLVTLYGPPLADGATYKNIHVFANGSYDRSPGGTGTSHVMALLFARGEIREDDVVVSEGISGSLFEGRILGRDKVGEFDAIVPEISGTAHLTGFHQFVIDPDDPIASGFLLG